ncbi:MAG: citrate transporter, partial [Bacteroidota bacterium]
MKKYIGKKVLILLIFSLIACSLSAQHDTGSEDSQDHTTTEETHSEDQSGHDSAHDLDAHDSSHGEHHAHMPATWSVIPFIFLLILIATGPVFFEEFWHHNYK